jgi:hypothetical protein
MGGMGKRSLPMCWSLCAVTAWANKFAHLHPLEQQARQEDHRRIGQTFRVGVEDEHPRAALVTA